MREGLTRRRTLPAAALLVLTAVWFAVRATHGIHFASFSDESGHFLGARAIRAGDRLYRDFIDAHGPLSFIVAQASGVVFGWQDAILGRWSIAAIVAVTAMFVFASAALRHPAARCWAASLFLGLIAAPWLVQALNMVNYHVLGGALVTVVVAGLILPAWFGAAPGRVHAFAAGASLPLLCADAYSLAPSAVLLAVAGLCLLHAKLDKQTRRGVVVWLATGVACAAGALLLWMLVYADLVGYLVFHIISNQVNYARYGTFGWAVMLRSLVPSAAPDALVQSGASVAFLSGLLLLLTAPTGPATLRHGLRTVGVSAFVLAICMLNFRGGFGFQDGSFLVASMAILALALPIALERRVGIIAPSVAWLATAAFFGVAAGYEFADRAALSSPGGLTRAQFANYPTIRLAEADGLPVTQRLHQVLRPGERYLALVYDPEIFLLTGYLPIHRFHEYLPWEADYARHPWFGRARDLCAEVAARPPPVIVYDAWKVWGLYDPARYMTCIPKLLATGYVADAVTNLYVRRDRARP